MHDERVVFVSEEEAGRLWKRAAELQVEESRRVERRTRALHATPGPTGFPEGEHLPLEEVEAAALEVGIDQEFLRTAVSELQEERAAGETPPPDFIERCANRFVGSLPSALDVTSLIPAPPSEVYRILQSLLPGDPYHLRLRSTLGVDPLEDGVLVFDAPKTSIGRSSYSRRVLMARDRVGRLYVRLRSAEVDGKPGCRVTIRGRVEADPEPAFWAGSALTAAFGAGGGLLGAAAGAGLGIAGGFLLVPALGAAAACGALTYWSFRAQYVQPFVRALQGLHELLEVLQAAVKTGGGFLPVDRAGVSEKRIQATHAEADKG